MLSGGDRAGRKEKAEGVSSALTCQPRPTWALQAPFIRADGEDTWHQEQHSDFAVGGGTPVPQAWLPLVPRDLARLCQGAKAQSESCVCSKSHRPGVEQQKCTLSQSGGWEA